MHLPFLFLFLLTLLFVSVIGDGAYESYQRKAREVRQRLAARQHAVGPPKESRKIKRYKCVEEIVEVFDDDQPPPPTVIIDDSKEEFHPREQPKGEPTTPAQSPKVVDAPKAVTQPKIEDAEPETAAVNAPPRVATAPKAIAQPTNGDDELETLVAPEPRVRIDIPQPKVRIDIPEPKVNRVQVDEKAGQEETKEEVNIWQVEAPTIQPPQREFYASLPNDAPRARAIKVQVQKQVQQEKVVAAGQKLYQLAEAQCNLIKSTASTYRVRDVRGWVRKNCVIAKMYLPSATCEELNMYVDSCFK